MTDTDLGKLFRDHIAARIQETLDEQKSSWKISRENIKLWQPAKTKEIYIKITLAIHHPTGVPDKPTRTAYWMERVGHGFMPFTEGIDLDSPIAWPEPEPRGIPAVEVSHYTMTLKRLLAVLDFWTANALEQWDSFIPKPSRHRTRLQYRYKGHDDE